MLWLCACVCNEADLCACVCNEADNEAEWGWNIMIVNILFFLHCCIRLSDEVLGTISLFCSSAQLNILSLWWAWSWSHLQGSTKISISNKKNSGSFDYFSFPDKKQIFSRFSLLAPVNNIKSDHVISNKLLSFHFKPFLWTWNELHFVWHIYLLQFYYYCFVSFSYTKMTNSLWRPLVNYSIAGPRCSLVSNSTLRTFSSSMLTRSSTPMSSVIWHLRREPGTR